MLKLADTLTLPDGYVTSTGALLAVRGAGKSNTAAVMAEEMFAHKLPFVVIDPVGAWWGLRSNGNGKGPGLAVPIFGGKRGDLGLERGAGELVADLIVDQRLSCVLDLSTFRSEGDKKAFLLAFALRLYQKNEDPLHLFLEEADDYIPQKPMRDEAHLLRAFENIVRRGRGRGLGITLITQRSAAIAKMVLTQTETLFAMRTTGPQDIKAIEAWVQYHQADKDILASLASLEDGEAWVWSPHFLKTVRRVRIRRRWTFDSGATPKNVKAGQARKVATLADVDLEALRGRMAATIEKAKADDPRELRKEIARLKLEVAKHLKVPDRKAQILKESKVIEKPVITDADRELLTKVGRTLEGMAAELGGRSGAFLGGLEHRLEQVVEGVMAEARKEGERVHEVGRKQFAHLLDSKRFQKILDTLAAVNVVRQPQPPMARPATAKPTPNYSKSITTPATTEGLTPAKQKILNGLAFLHGIGVPSADKTQLALIVGVSPTSGGYFNNLGNLRNADGLIDYPDKGTVALTSAGEALASTDGVPATTAELHEAIRAKLPAAKWKIVEALIAVYPNAMTKDALAEQIGVSPTSGGYFNNLGSLRSLGLITYPRKSEVAALPVLFLEDR